MAKAGKTKFRKRPTRKLRYGAFQVLTAALGERLAEIAFDAVEKALR